MQLPLRRCVALCCARALQPSCAGALRFPPTVRRFVPGAHAFSASLDANANASPVPPTPTATLSCAHARHFTRERRWRQVGTSFRNECDLSIADDLAALAAELGNGRPPGALKSGAGVPPVGAGAAGAAALRGAFHELYIRDGDGVRAARCAPSCGAGLAVCRALAAVSPLPPRPKPGACSRLSRSPALGRPPPAARA